MHRTIRVAALIVGTLGLVVLPSSAALAAPNNAPNRLVGTADCGSDGAFDFVVNSGRTNANTWNPAFVTRSDGRTGLFIPVSFDLTFTSPFGNDTEVAAKHTAPGPVSCDISANPFPGASLTGTVTGTIIWTG